MENNADVIGKVQESTEKIGIDIKPINGLRGGKISFEKIIEEFPKQIITSTNEGQINNFKEDIDLDTKVSQIYLNLKVDELNNHKSKIRIAKSFINMGNRINWIFMKELFRTPRIKKQDIIDSLNLQNEMQCKIKSLHLPKNIEPKLAIELLNDYPNSIVYMDMNDISNHFKQIYLHCIKINVKIICFIIRDISNKNLENYKLIGKREEDNVLRIAVHFSKINSIIDYKSLSHFLYLQGFDGFAFKGGSKSHYKTTPEDLSMYVAGEYRFENIQTFKACDCKAHKGRIPYQQALDYHEENKTSIPSSLHDILEINEDFKKIREKLFKNEINLDKLKEEFEFESISHKFLESKRTKK